MVLGGQLSPREEGDLEQVSFSESVIDALRTRRDQLASTAETLRTRLTELNSLGKRASVIDETIKRALDAVFNHRQRLHQEREAVARRLSSEDVKVTVHYQGDVAGSLDSLREIVGRHSGFDSFFSTDEGVLSLVTEHPRSPEYAAQLATVRTLMLSLHSELPDKAPKTQFSVNARLRSAVSAVDKSTYELGVRAWAPADRVEVRHRPRPNANMVDISEGSPGQRTAALLAVLLNLQESPLLIDQPEDDLDNRLVFNLVVATLRRSKKQRQIIVATHNANVVVNGDAENVIVLRHGATPEVEASGGIQGNEVRASVCDIMEGGRQALKLRFDRLLIESPFVP